jgi:hypothetical protein
MTLRNDPLRGPDVIVERDVAVIAPVDAGARALRWGPIVAGLLTALGTFILLSLLAVGIGLSTTTDPQERNMVATIVGSLIALVSFFLGGFVAAWSDNAVDNRRGALDGFLVWALWLLVVLLAGAIGLSALFGDLGALFPTGDSPDVNALRSGALRTFLALALTAASAALGGVVGTRDRIRTRLGAF